MAVYLSLDLNFAKKCPNIVRIVELDGEDIVYNIISYAPSEQSLILRYKEKGKTLPVGGFFHYDNRRKEARELTEEEKAKLLI